ncbi:MAG: M3 family metallopeptidase [Campylobacterales bacterium]|nr:M3 family metallopeptidase [Campylobacterales bacterium]
MEFKEPDYDDFIPKLKDIIKKYNQKVDVIIKADSNDYNETLKPLEELDEELSLYFTPLSHLNSVSNSDQTQKTYEEALPILSEFHTRLSHNKELYKKIKSITTKKEDEQRVINEALKDFELAGVNLPKEKKLRLEEIDVNLSNLSNEFSQNLLNATNEYTLIIKNEKDIEGIPNSALEPLKKELDGKIVYEFNLQMPSYIAYMTYGSNRNLRERLYRAYTSRAPQNAQIIDKILKLREEEAKILGFDNYAQYALSKRDANSTDEIVEFLEKMIVTAKEYAKEEFEELSTYAKKIDNIEQIESYDMAYYAQKLQEEKFDFDERITQEYFEQNRVLEGLLSRVSALFDIKFKALELKLWHPCVKTYDIYENDELRARIYFDLEARSSKRSGAWMNDFETHFFDSKENRKLASAFIVCNFATASKETPSLLRHDDVVTLFHEMGHALHHLLSKNAQRPLSGINGVAWDVVEFPSQFLENFAYQKDILKSIGTHYKSGKKIPDLLVDKIIQTKNFQAALGLLRQIEFSLFDIKLHLQYHNIDQTQELLDTIRKKTSFITVPRYNKFQNSFSHIFAGGYAAGYYSYKWAEVLSADAFIECLDEDGAFDTFKAKGYKEHILSKGSLRDMRKLYKEWLNKEPDIESLAKLYGLTKERE